MVINLASGFAENWLFYMYLRISRVCIFQIFPELFERTVSFCYNKPDSGFMSLKTSPIYVNLKLAVYISIKSFLFL